MNLYQIDTQPLARSTLYNKGRGRYEREWPLSADQEETIVRFITSLSGKAAMTRRKYEQDVRHFFAFVNASWSGLPVESLTREHAETWVRFLQGEAGYGPSSVKGMVQAARILCAKLVDDDVLEGNPFAHVKDLPAAPMPDVAILDAADVQAMLDAAKKEKNVWGKRDRAIMGVLFYGGLRRDELLNIHEEDIDWKRESLKIRRGKGGDPRTIGLDYRALGLLDQYMSARRRYLSGLKPYRRKALETLPIWVSMRGGALGDNGIAEMLTSRARQAKITKPTHPHIWRHSAATHDADNGMGDMEMRNKYGWAPTSAMPFRYSRATLTERTIKKSRSIRGEDGVKL